MLRTCSVVFSLLFCLAVAIPDAAGLTILDENVDDVIGMLPNGDGTPTVTSDAFAGAEALSIAVSGGDGQNFNDAMPDWAFNIVENPSADNEYRYITFAWKKDGGDGVQLQLHGNPDTWGHRYHAGANVQNWTPSIQVDTSIPADWTSLTRDLFDDWGEFTLTGVAFTAWDGNAGLWDAVHLHQDASPPTAVEPKDKLATTWASLKDRR